MTRTLIEFYDDKAVIGEHPRYEKSAIVEFPDLDEEVALPVRYKVASPDGTLSGELTSYFPDRKRITHVRNGTRSDLFIGENNQMTLQTGEKRFDIGMVSIDDLASDVVERQKALGFSHGFRIRSAEETGELDFYSVDGETKAALTSGETGYDGFLPIILYDRVMNDLEGREIKKSQPQKESLGAARRTIVGEDGPFAKFVKATFKPRELEKAFPYQDQHGERDRLFEYLDTGLRPVILNGPTGNGKTVLARNYAAERGKPFYFDTGSSSFRLSTATGKFVPGPDGPTFSPGSLALAAIHGGLYVMEEVPPIPQDELTGLNIFLETGELPLITQFGHEVITAHPDFRLVATGNFHAQYTNNELNDAFLQRFNQIKIGYPSIPNTTDILLARAPGLDVATAETLASAVSEMRDKAKTFSKDLGLKGPVEVAQRIVAGSEIPMIKLLEEGVINPITTYESESDANNGKLHSKLMEIARKFGG